jgi:F-type H+-transporting ATPase subunit b
MAILYDTYFVVALSFVFFVAILYRYKIHHMLLSSLDARAERIRAELDEAKRLREEAQTLLASYEQRQREIEGEAAQMVEQAKRDAKESAEAMKQDALGAIDRRVKAANEQLAASEAAAIRAVKDRAVAVAVAAASDVLRQNLSADAVNASIDDAIAVAGQRLN